MNDVRTEEYFDRYPEAVMNAYMAYVGAMYTDSVALCRHVLLEGGERITPLAAMGSETRFVGCSGCVNRRRKSDSDVKCDLCGQLRKSRARWMTHTAMLPHLHVLVEVCADCEFWDSEEVTTTRYFAGF